MALGHWLVKSEPGTYGWEHLVKEKRTLWTGVRNFTARNHLAAMKTGDLVLFYHSGEGKEIVGVAQVTAEAQPDPTREGRRGLGRRRARAREAARGAGHARRDQGRRPSCATFPLVKLSRLSVMPIPKAAFDRILAMGKTKLG